MPSSASAHERHTTPLSLSDSSRIDQEHVLKNSNSLLYMQIICLSKAFFWQKRDFRNFFFDFDVCWLFWLIDMFEEYMWESNIKREMIVNAKRSLKIIDKIIDAQVNLHIFFEHAHESKQSAYIRVKRNFSKIAFLSKKCFCQTNYLHVKQRIWIF